MTLARRALGAAAVALALGILAGCASKPAIDTPQQAQAQQQSLPPVKPQVVPPEERSQLHAQLAAGYFERGRMDIAIEEANDALKLDSRNARAYNVLGLVYGVLGERPKAEEAFGRALQIAPQDSEIRQNYGWYLCTNGRARESIPEFEAALRNPLYRSADIALINAGKCSAAFGEVAQAETYFRRALQASPGNAIAAYNLALVAYKAARFDEARSSMRIVMQETNPPPEALFLGMCIERRKGDAQAELSYVSQLRNRYPDAAETKAINTGGCE
jgi:type IV pilus assembly protein PilF